MAIRSVLVTGGAGYIGSHLVDRLVSRDYRVTVLDNLEPQVHRTGAWPSYVNPRATYVRGDVRDRAAFEPLVAEWFIDFRLNTKDDQSGFIAGERKYIGLRRSVSAW